MKYLLVLLAIVSAGVAAETVINYDDGSTYATSTWQEGDSSN